MTYRVRFDDLAAMTEAERNEELAALVRAARAPNPEGRRTLVARVRAYEERHGMSSDALLAGLRDGSIAETAEISEWLFWLNARDCSSPERG